MMAKFKVGMMVSLYRETEIDTSIYPEDWTKEEILNVEKSSIEDDPFLTMDHQDTKIKVLIEEIE